MAEWITTTLEECTDILGDGLHGTPKYTENGEYAFVNGNNLVDGEILIKKETKRVDYSQYDKYKKPLTNRTILVSINGTLGNVGVYGSEKIILGKSACYFNVKESVDKDFIYYIVSSPTFKQYLESNATGTTIKNISLKQMREYTFELPEIGEQKRISSVLRKIDEKIKNNRAINNNLEQQALALFKSWFIDFEPFDGQVPKAWLNGVLGDFVEIKRGGSPRPIQNFLSDSGFHWLKISDATGISSPFINEIKEYIIEAGLKKTVYLKSGSLVLSNSATPGLPKILDINTCIHDGWLYFPSSKFSNEYLYLYFKHIRDNLIALGNGSVFTNLKTDILKNYPTYLPTEDVLKKFDGLVQPIFSMILSKTRETKRLAEIRDALLPKLMSGELDVSDIEL